MLPKQMVYGGRFTLLLTVPASIKTIGKRKVIINETSFGYLSAFEFPKYDITNLL